MTELAQSILEQALELPIKERAHVADRLMESIGPPGEDLSPEEWYAACTAELDARQAATDAGELGAVPLEQVLEEMRAPAKHG